MNKITSIKFQVYVGAVIILHFTKIWVKWHHVNRFSK